MSYSSFDFTDWTLVHDIAILKLDRKVNLNRPEVNTVCLPLLANRSLLRLERGELLGLLRGLGRPRSFGPNPT